MKEELGEQDAVTGTKPAKKDSDGKAKKKYVAFAIVVIAIVMIASMAVLYSNHKPEASGPLSATTGVTNTNTTTVGIPLTSISQNATWYDYNISGSTVRFFAVKDVNGTVHTAFDECWMCYSSHLGYRQNGSTMVENHCNMSFPTENITAAGCTGMGCHPILLPSMIVGDQLVIQKTNLSDQRFVFLRADEQAMVHSVNMTDMVIPMS